MVIIGVLAGKHIRCKQNRIFCRNLEAEIIEFQWMATINNKADMSTKNLAGLECNKLDARLCGCNGYFSTAQDGHSHEQGRVSGVSEAGVKTREIMVSAPGIK